MSSDREGQLGSAPPVDEDLSLPKATVQKMISGPAYSFIPKFGLMLSKRTQTFFQMTLAARRRPEI